MFTFEENNQKIYNFKAPGPDNIQNIAIKKLINLHTSLLTVYNTMLHAVIIQPWLGERRTTLIQNKSQRQLDASNYTQIACLYNL